MGRQKEKGKQKGIGTPSFWNDKSSIALAIFAVAVSAIAMFPSLENGFTNWDDDLYVIENQMVKEFKSEHIIQPVSGNFHPLTMLSLSWDYTNGEGKPGSFHRTNFVLHLANVFLVFWLLWLLSGKSRIAAFTGSLLFGIHPMHVESVAWISERKDVLYSVFFLSGLIAYRHHQKSKKWIHLLATFAFFFLSLLSKPAAICFPFVLLLFHFYPGFQIRRSDLYRLIPFAIVSLCWAFLTWDAQSESGSTATAEFDFFRQMAIGGFAAAYYVIQFFAPVSLSPYHPLPMGELPAYYFPAGVLFLLLLVLIILFRKKFPVIFFGFFFFLITIALVLQFIPVGHAAVAERYTYIPYIGLSIPVAAFASFVAADPRFAKIRQWFAALGILIACIFAYVSMERCKVWKDSNTLWTAVLKSYPDDAFAYGKRGQFLAVSGKTEEAAADYTRALQRDPGMADVWHNLGEIWMEKGMKGKALEHFDKAIALRPDYAAAWNNRGNVFFRDQRWTEAVENYGSAILADPSFIKAFINRGNANLRLKNFDAALADLGRAIALDPEFAQAYFVRAFVFRDMGESKRYQEDLLKAQSLGYQVPREMMKDQVER